MLLSQKLVDLIERNADELTRKWLENLEKHPATSTYRKLDQKKLYDYTFDIYREVGKWISKETTKEDIARYYIPLGRFRRKEGIPLSEVVQALIIMRRLIWIKVLEEGALDTALDLHQAMNLNNRVVVFFDRAIYYTIKGYEGAEKG